MQPPQGERKRRSRQRERYEQGQEAGEFAGPRKRQQLMRKAVASVALSAHLSAQETMHTSRGSLTWPV